MAFPHICRLYIMGHTHIMLLCRFTSFALVVFSHQLHQLFKDLLRHKLKCSLHYWLLGADIDSDTTRHARLQKTWFHLSTPVLSGGHDSIYSPQWEPSLFTPHHSLLHLTPCCSLYLAPVTLLLFLLSLLFFTKSVELIRNSAARTWTPVDSH